MAQWQLLCYNELMADAETEKEWAKLKEIEAEKMKATQALAEEKENKENLAYFDAKMLKKRVKGFSKDPNVIIESAEKYSEKGVIFAPLGLALSIIGMMGGVLTEIGNFGLGGVIISSIPSGIGMILMFIAGFLAITTLVLVVAFAGKSKKKILHIIVADVFTIAVLVAGYFLKFMI